MEKWSRSVAVVTGANSGNGFEILKRLARSGITVVGFDTRTENIDKFKFEDETLKIFSVICDTLDEDESEIAFEWVEDTLGGVDILITNVKNEMNDNRFNDIKVHSALRCGKIASKSMKTRGYYGYIVHIFSKPNPIRYEDLKQIQSNKIRVKTITADRETSKNIVEIVENMLSAPLF